MVFTGSHWILYITLLFLGTGKTELSYRKIHNGSLHWENGTEKERQWIGWQKNRHTHTLTLTLSTFMQSSVFYCGECLLLHHLLIQFAVCNLNVSKELNEAKSLDCLTKSPMHHRFSDTLLLYLIDIDFNSVAFSNANLLFRARESGDTFNPVKFNSIHLDFWMFELMHLSNLWACYTLS